MTISGTHIRFVVLRVATGSLAIHYGFAARQECTWAFFVSSQLPSLAANRVLQQEITAIEYIRLGSRSIPSHQKSQELSNLDTNEVIISNHTFSPWLSLDWEESVLVIDRLTGDWLLFINMVERKLMVLLGFHCQFGDQNAWRSGWTFFFSLSISFFSSILLPVLQVRYEDEDDMRQFCSWIFFSPSLHLFPSLSLS